MYRARTSTSGGLQERGPRGSRTDRRRATSSRALRLEPLEVRALLTLHPLTLADPAFAGVSAFGDSSTPTLSDDGQWMAFQSAADNLVPNDTNGRSDVFVYNRAANAVTLVSVALDGAAAGDCNQYSAPVVSPDGRYVAFECISSNPLVSGKSGDEYYLRDLVNGTTTLLTPNASGNGNGCASAGLYGIAFTADSKHVLFVATQHHTGTAPSDFDYNLTTDQVVYGEGNIFERNLDTNQTRLVSADMAGVGVGISTGGGVYHTVNFRASADGRFVAFVSGASTYVSNDLNNSTDVFVRDMQNNTTALVSGDYLNNKPAVGDSFGSPPTISADGRFVTFVSAATGLTALDPRFCYQAYVRDMQSGVTTAVSVSSNGVFSSSNSLNAVISADGRTIAFSTSAGLLPQDTNGNGDVYAYDPVSHALSLVSVNAAGTNGGNADAGTVTYLGPPPLVITPDGRFVLFRSAATDLVSGVSVAHQNLYQRDLASQVTKLVSGASDGLSSGNADSDTTVVSSDGRYVAFQSPAGNLVAGDGNYREDIFVRDMTGSATQLGSLRSALLPPVVFAERGGALGSASSDGRYVVFTSLDGIRGSNQNPSDFLPNQPTPYTDHVLLRDTQTGTVSFIDLNATGTQPLGGSHPVISADGRFVYFQSSANLDAAHPNTTGSRELYVRDLTAGVTTLVSRSTSGGPAAGNIEFGAACSVSADGRYAVWNAQGTSMVSGMVDSSGGFPGNVFIADRTTGVVKLVSHVTGSAAQSGNGFSRYPIISADGSKVAFTSRATDLISGVTDANAAGDLFVYDVAGETVSLASVSTTGTATGDDVSGDPDVMGGARFAISNNGRYLFFASNADNLTANDAGWCDVFRRDLADNVTTLVSVNAAGSAAANGHSSWVAISADGARVAFESAATDLLSGFVDNNGSFGYDIFVRDLAADGTITNTMLASANGVSATASGNATSDMPVLSPDGRYVAFTSESTDLTSGFVNANGSHDDLFVRDLQAGTTVLATANQAGTAGGATEFVFNAPDVRQFSSTGTLFFNSYMSDLVPADRNRIVDVFSFTPAGAGVISGTVFGDVDGNGALNGELGRRDWTVYLDANNNGALDAGETRLQTDAAGNFTFNNLAPGSYTLRAQPQTGYLQTTPADLNVTIASNGQVVAGQNIGEQVQRTDLAVTAAAAPATGRIGGSLANITWTVTNNGTSADGAWQDAIYLSTSPSLTNSAVLLATVDHAGGLAAGAHYDGNATVTIPTVMPDDYYIIVQADRRNEAPFEADRTDNVLAASATALDVPTLALGADFSSDAFTAVGQTFYYKIVVPSDSGGMTVNLTSAAAGGGTSLYLRRGQLPTAWEYDLKANVAGQPNQYLANPMTPVGTYYVMARAESGAAATSGFALRAEIPAGLQLVSTDNAWGVDHPGLFEGYTSTIAIRGLNLTPTTTAQLVNAQRTITASSIVFQDSTEIFATFTLTYSPFDRIYGDYNLQLVDGAQTSSTLPFEILPRPFGPSWHFQFDPVIRLQAPSLVRHHGQVYCGVIEYFNSSPQDMVAPLIVLSATHARIKLPDDATFSGDFDSSTVQFLGISPSGPAGTLRAGSPGRQVFYFQPGPDGIGDFQVQFDVGVLGLGVAMDWASMKDSLRPSSIQAGAWDAIYDNLTSTLGDTANEYNARLAQTATYLGSIGAPTGNVGELWSFLVAQANAQFSIPALSSVTDASLQTPGLTLALTRNYGAPISSRDRLGIFGYGWSTPWETSLATDSAGNVTIDSGGASRFFKREPDGSYRGGPGEYGALRLSAGIYTLTEASGVVSVFRGDGKLDYMQDANGNRITLGYNGVGQLISLTHSDGQALTLTYSGAFVSQLQDSAGRVTQYTYTTGASGRTLLANVAGPWGTTVYHYAIVNLGAAPIVDEYLSQITSPDGSNRYFSYDAQGRIQKTNLDGNAETATYAYNQGQVTATDALGHTTAVWLNASGQPMRVDDAHGRQTSFSYDARLNLVRAVDRLGAEFDYAYDNYGNLTSIVDPLGQTVSMVYGGPFNQMTQITDARGNSIQYAFDPHGNLRTITYPNGGQESFSYDPLGNLSETINRRGHATSYTTDSAGRVTQVDFADHSSQTFVYDSFGNLITAADAAGSITLSYANPADGRLTQIVYPGARSLAFSYDAGGRRIRSVDQDGFTVNYAYDAAGRLSELTDGGNNRIVLYTYDAAGQLVRKDNGNGTFTVYAYNAVGNIANIDNFQSDGVTKNSFFAYTYDAAGRVIASVSADGLTAYGYDALGQLASAALPGGRTIVYTYDAAGNRIKTVDSLLGTTTCTVNNENRITQLVGPGGTAAYAYDADGNLQTVIDPSGATTYSFNDLNQLTAVAGPAGAFNFTYNSLGSRASQTVAGQTTSYLVDPSGLGSVVATYGAGNTLIAHYIQGLGLAGQTSPSGTGFYDFDVTGNTVGISGAGGNYLNQYRYLPFGETTASIAPALPNPFTFVGQFGVAQDATGLSYMRARYFSPAVGQFISDDPLGLLGGDENLRRYSQNSPVNLIDPSGLDSIFDTKEGKFIDNSLKSNEQYKNTKNALDALHDIYKNATGTDKERIKFLSDKLQGAIKNKACMLPGNKLMLMMDGSPSAQLAAGMLQRLVSLSEDYENNHKNFALTQPEVAERQQLKAALAAISGHDPNDILGPAGYGPQKFVAEAATLPYTIEFENASTATAPAQEVFVTHQLDADLDFSTFELGSFGFGTALVTIPAGLQQYATEVPYHNADGTPLTVHASFTFDQQTGLLTVALQSVDPSTGALPLDPLAGLLPPNDSTNCGQGFVQYTIKPKSSATTGTALTQLASIVFDGEAPIVTPTITNTIDAGLPTSSVTALPLQSYGAFIWVSWAGSDEEGAGSGVAVHDVYVSDNGGPYQLWQDGATTTSARFHGQIGHTYEFYSEAIDNVGHRELAPLQADTTTTLAPAITTCGVYDPALSQFYLRYSNSQGGADSEFAFGAPGWEPVAGDWNGDGKYTIGLFQREASQFYLRNQNAAGNADISFGYGVPGSNWILLMGDWDGNGTDTIGSYDPTASQFYLKNANEQGNADVSFGYGAPGLGWTPVIGDWNGDGTDTIGFYDSATGMFYLRNTNDMGMADIAFPYGVPGSNWQPLIGDWDGNGEQTIGFFLPEASTFFLRNTNNIGNADVAFGLGYPGCMPIVGDWLGPTGQALLAAESGQGATASLSSESLAPILAAALARWSAVGASLAFPQVVVTDLPGAELGRAADGALYLDQNAAGHGWFVDPTPAVDEEFVQLGGRRLQAVDARAVDRMDLLTVVEHELGHLAGLPDLETSVDNLMSGLLAAGIRRTRGAAPVDAVVAVL